MNKKIYRCIECGKELGCHKAKRCFTCSHKKQGEDQKGENNSRWNGGLPNCSICGKKLGSYKASLCRQCSGKQKRGVKRPDSVREKMSKAKRTDKYPDSIDGKILTRKEYDLLRNNTPRMKLRGRIKRSLRYKLKQRTMNKNGLPTFETLSFTVNELEKHLESLFTKGMNWVVFFEGKIHIDHIVPDSFFDYESIEDDGFKQSWALSNLKPMWAKDNLSKSDRIVICGVLTNQRARNTKQILLAI